MQYNYAIFYKKYNFSQCPTTRNTPNNLKCKYVKEFNLMASAPESQGPESRH